MALSTSLTIHPLERLSHVLFHVSTVAKSWLSAVVWKPNIVEHRGFLTSEPL